MEKAKYWKCLQPVALKLVNIVIFISKSWYMGFPLLWPNMIQISKLKLVLKKTLVICSQFCAYTLLRSSEHLQKHWSSFFLFCSKS